MKSPLIQTALCGVLPFIAWASFLQAQTEVTSLTGNINNSAIWSDNLPSPTNHGTIGINGTWGVANSPNLSNWVVSQSTGTINRTTSGNILLRDLTEWNLSGGSIQASDGAVSVGANVDSGGATLNMTGGSVSASANFNVTHSTSQFNLSSGTVVSGNIFSLSAGSKTSISGGSVTASSMSLGNAQTQLTITGGSLSIAGNLSLTSTTTLNSWIQFGPGAGSLSAGGLVLEGNGYLDFMSTSSGSITITGYSSSDYENLWSSSRLRFDGANTGSFSDHFVVTGSTLSVIPEPSLTGLALGVLGVLCLLQRRKKGVCG